MYAMYAFGIKYMYWCSFKIWEANVKSIFIALVEVEFFSSFINPKKCKIATTECRKNVKYAMSWTMKDILIYL